MGDSRVSDTLKTSPAVKCMKFLLSVYNVILFVTGLAILTIGVLSWTSLKAYADLGDNSFKSAIVLICFGFGLLIVGVAACICTYKGVSFLLYLYGFVLILAFIVEIAIAISAFALRGKFGDEMSSGFKNAMNNYKKDPDSLDLIQENLKCCGSHNYTDWFTVDWTGQGTSTTVYSVPKSCCSVDQKSCTNTGLDSGANDIYKQGCEQKILDFIEDKIAIIGGVTIGFCFLNLFGAIIACCLAKNINKAKYEEVA